MASAALAREMTADYLADTDGLGLGRPDHEPLATETIAEILELIEALIERGHAYEAGGDVYFRVRSYAHYGELSHRDVDQMDQGEGVEGAERKDDPLDFALWKAHKEGEDTAWDCALGPRAARLAHRVLGDGRGAARASTSTSTAAARTSSSPTTRTRPPRPRRARASRSPGSGCTTG